MAARGKAGEFFIGPEGLDTSPCYRLGLEEVGIDSFTARLPPESNTVGEAVGFRMALDSLRLSM